MRTALLALAVLCLVVSAIMSVGQAPRGILVAGLGVVALVFIVLVSMRIRRASTNEATLSSDRSMRQVSDTPGCAPRSVDRDFGERQVA